jgi:hypothetical protein
MRLFTGAEKPAALTYHDGKSIVGWVERPGSARSAGSRARNPSYKDRGSPSRIPPLIRR